MAGPTPAHNQPTSQYTSKSSLVAYDFIGNPVQLDLYYTKGPDDIWEVSVFDHAEASAGGFPYGVAGSPPLATGLMRFENGKLDSAMKLNFDIPGGHAFTLDFSGTSQLATAFTVLKGDVDGHEASAATGYVISDDGVVSLRFSDGSLQPSYRIPLADVMSPDNLTMIQGNAYVASGTSGVTVMGFPGQAGFGKVTSGSLEGSNVDVASELTEMIQAQRSYTANSKVFQTGADLMDVLINLKR